MNLTPQSLFAKGILALLFLSLFQFVSAQQWTGSTTTAGLLIRNGNIFSGNGNFALSIDTGTRALELIGSTTDIIDMRSSAYPGSYLVVMENGSVGYHSNFPMAFEVGPLGTSLVHAMTIAMNGNVLIGQISQVNPAYMLDVAGNVRSNQMVVNTTGADFVFDSTYRLPPLHEVEAYIRQQHHLPGIAPAATMRKEGLDLGENQTRLLQKVEELTLYTIEQQRQIRELQEKNRQIDALEAKLAAIEALLKDKK
jgi:hypothetical protein